MEEGGRREIGDMLLCTTTINCSSGDRSGGSSSGGSSSGSGKPDTSNIIAIRAIGSASQ